MVLVSEDGLSASTDSTQRETHASLSYIYKTSVYLILSGALSLGLPSVTYTTA